MDIKEIAPFATIGSFIIALLVNLPKLKEILGPWRYWLYSVFLFVSGAFAGILIASLFIPPTLSPEVVLTWGPVDALQIIPGDPPSMKGSKVNQLIVNGSLLQYWAKKNYKMIGVCYHYIVSGDPLDQLNISKSGLYDIKDDHVTISIPWNDIFTKEFLNGKSPTIYALILVPKGVTVTSFATVRQAIDLGGNVIQMRTGPP